VAWGLDHAKVNEFALATLQPLLDLPQTVRLAKLAKEHRNELVPTGETSRVAHAIVLTYCFVEQRSRY